jgi:CDP-6-deoxy-D-xylo-4-hexulose-3-dehydrase
MLLPFRATSPDAAKQIVRGLELAGIETRPILTGNFTAQPALARLLDEVVLPSDFPGANVVSTECFMVGCHHHFADSQVEHLAEILRNSGT